MSSNTIIDHRRRNQFVGYLLGVAGLVIGVCLIVQSSNPRTRSTATSQRLVGLASAKSLASQRSTGTKPIEMVRVGDRVLARNPQVSDAKRSTWREPDWNDWLHLQLVMSKRDGSELFIELLRPESWVLERISYVVAEQGDKTSDPPPIVSDGVELEGARPARHSPETHASSDPLSPLRPFYRDVALTSADLEAIGAGLARITIALDLPEMGAKGIAVVTEVNPCPPIKAGEGQPVTATFMHQSSSQVLDVLFEGEPNSIGVTDNHLFWSVDCQRFIPIGQLDVGDRVQTYSGETKRIAGKLPRPGPEAVYNLEVYGEHVYFVGQQGLLAHNLYEANGNVVYSDALDELLPAANQQTARQIKNARQRGVNRAKAAERQLIQDGHPGTANEGGFTFAERKQIAETGQYPSDIRWHHINDVKRNPDLAEVPDNVIPSRGGAAGHVKNFHPNGTRAGSSGPLIDRESLRQKHLNGENM
ncbi:polymorphic toxin-type HINT domain-containing protein [Roseiconus lacunae]|uniref:Polymorphic toxin-type HINT domain-containing protein n=1 Tax=Roseiconus lacunae TaxID=2605694 RepID=A0ABT7PHG8_9BACT|nr:polymorphic toxin-type HINT domain-containing protein [Roseiconus lacunae]MDM4015942.1 polymorphic toxin-type HINT domain-containing protein [Roseiconus lacunae]